MGPATTEPKRSRPKDPAPQLAQLRVPSDASLPALGSYASLIWRLTTQHLKEAPVRPGSSLQEYKIICEFMPSYWHRMRDRANVLCEALDYQPFPVSSRWNPLTTTGAGLYLHVFITALWATSLFIRFVPPR